MRVEPLLGNAGERGVRSVYRVAYVCQCARWLADSLADSEQVIALGRCERSYLGEGVRRITGGLSP